MSEADRALTARLQRWADGKTTLKDVRGYTDEELFSIARTGYFFYYQGKIAEWRDDLGFGFITPNGGGQRIFGEMGSDTISPC